MREFRMRALLTPRCPAALPAVRFPTPRQRAPFRAGLNWMSVICWNRRGSDRKRKPLRVVSRDRVEHRELGTDGRGSA